MSALYRWLIQYWVASALCMGICLLLLVPLLVSSWDAMLLLIFLHTPIYMLHQVEEHTGDRFRRYVNTQVFGGVEALTPVDILWINLPGVWGVTLASLYAARFIGAGWGLAAVYLVPVNGVVHVAGALVSGRYNPGLWTALALFLPLGGVTLWCAAGFGWMEHSVGLAIAIAIHVAIAAHARLKARTLAS
jgi:hypothetical protein